MKSLALAALLALALQIPVAHAAVPAERVLETQVVIAAPVGDLWKALTDGEAYRKWAGGPAAVDLRIGGSFEASYDAKGHIGDPGNLRHRIIAYVPERLIVFQNVQAPGLPDEALYRGMTIVVRYEPLGPQSTRVVVDHIGFGQGAGYDRLYAFFQKGDAGMLEAMKAAYEKR